MQEVPCPLCNIYSTDVVITENGYSGKKCPCCNTIFISPRPSEDEIIALYEEDNAIVPAESHISGGLSKRLYARHNLALVKKHIKSGSLLEIGAGAGHFLQEARRQGFDVYGIEPNRVQANYINGLGIRCETAPLSASSFGGRAFDIIYHCDVLSHFYDPVKTFKTINSKLNDEGYIIFETGNLGDVASKFYRYFLGFLYPDHLSFFGEGGIKKLLNISGFDLIKIYHYNLLTPLVLKKLLSSSHPPVSISKNGTKKRSELARLASDIYDYGSYHLRYNFGSVYIKPDMPQTIIVVAKKILE